VAHVRINKDIRLLGILQNTLDLRLHIFSSLYKEYCKKVENPVVDRAYRNYMKKMVKLGLIKAENSGRWRSYKIVV
jgi:hypothetical protein